MPTFHMTLTRTDAANAEVHQRRDELRKKFGRPVDFSDLYNDPVISEHLRRYSQGVDESLLRRAKKADFKPGDNDHIAYCLSGADTGAIEFWTQRTFRS